MPHHQEATSASGNRRGALAEGSPPAAHTTARVSTAPQDRQEPPHRCAPGITTASQHCRGTPRAERPPGRGATRSSRSRGGAGRSGSGRGSRGWAIAAGPCPSPPHTYPPRHVACRSADRQAVPAARGGGASRAGRPRPLRHSGFPLVTLPAAQGITGRVTERPAQRPDGKGRGVLLSVIRRAAPIGQCGGVGGAEGRSGNSRESAGAERGIGESTGGARPGTRWQPGGVRCGRLVPVQLQVLGLKSRSRSLSRGAEGWAERRGVRVSGAGPPGNPCFNSLDYFILV